MRILRILLDGFKFTMNGAHLPNWAKLVILILIVLLVWIGQLYTVGGLAKAQRSVAWQQSSDLAGIREDISDMRIDIQEDLVAEARRDSIRTQRLERKIDAANRRIEDINENGTDYTNDKIEELMRSIRRQQRGGNGGGH